MFFHIQRLCQCPSSPVPAQLNTFIRSSSQVKFVLVAFVCGYITMIYSKHFIMVRVVVGFISQSLNTSGMESRPLQDNMRAHTHTQIHT